MDELAIINNSLRWDGSHLGSYYGVITCKWISGGIKYYKISFSDPYGIGPGILLCCAVCTKDVLPCIIEDIKTIFGLKRTGVHRISIDNKEYILYYVPVTVNGCVVWETPLSKLDLKHELRANYEFKKEVQKFIVFCDILALASTNETSIRIRPDVNETYAPICVNETTVLTKEDAKNYSILTKTLFTKWFGEETNLSDVVIELIEEKFGSIANRLCAVSAEIRNRIDEVIKRYDVKYLWYSYFIVDRLSRHLLLSGT